MNVVLECSRCMLDERFREAVCWVLDAERLCTRLVQPRVAPRVALRIVPTVQRLLRLAHAGADQNPAELVRAALSAHVAEAFVPWCMAQAQALPAGAEEEEAVLWHVLAGRTGAALLPAATAAGRPELAMALLQTEVPSVRRSLAQQAAAWRAKVPPEHPALASVLELVANGHSDALIQMLREKLRVRPEGEGEGDSLPAAAAVALAEWEQKVQHSAAATVPASVLLVRARALLRALVPEDEDADAGAPLLPLELLLACDGGRDDGAAWAVYETLVGRVGRVAGWALVRAGGAACPRATGTEALTRRAGAVLASAAAEARGAWPAAVLVHLSAGAVDEARARAVYTEHVAGASEREQRVCREVLHVPCSRWAALDRAQEAERAGDAWAAAGLYVDARAFVAAARCLHFVALRRVFCAADVAALAVWLPAVRAHRAELQRAWTPRLEAVCAYACLRNGPEDAEDAAAVHALCEAVAAAAEAEAVVQEEEGEEWRGLAHIAEHAALRLEHWTLMGARTDECEAAVRTIDMLPLSPDLHDSIVEALRAPSV